MEGGAVQPDELENVLNAVMESVNTHRSELEEKLASESGSTATRISEVLSELGAKEGELKELISRLDQAASTELSSIKELIKAEVERVIKLIPKLPDPTIVETRIKDVESKIPSAAPEFIRDQLESIAKEDEKLDMDAIRDLNKRFKELEKRISLRKNISIFGGNQNGGGKVVKVYDLSASLDGVLKTFPLPSFWRVISVTSSSFPTAFRPTVDYTTDASAMTITFTSEIEASTTLATGQTVIVVYAE